MRAFLRALFCLLCLSLLLAPAVVVSGEAPVPPKKYPATLAERLEILTANQAAAAGLNRRIETELAPNVSPEIPDDNSYTATRVVFATPSQDSWDIFETRLSESNINPLIVHPASDLQPSLQPLGGKQIAFVSNREGNFEIYTQAVEGGTPVRLTSHPADDAYPVWSPDGQRLAFTSERDGNAEIYIMLADGSGLVRLTQKFNQDFAPTWSPDGSRLAWVRRVDLDNGVIMAVNLENGMPAGEEFALTGPLRYLDNPAWSPDGAYLAYGADFDHNNLSELGIVNQDGSAARMLEIPYANDPEFPVEFTAAGWDYQGEVIFNKITYWLHPVSKELYLYRAHFGYRSISGDVNVTLNPYSEMVALDPDAQIMDVTPPTSQVFPLPPFSRAAGFKVRWWAADEFPGIIAQITIETRVKPLQEWTYWTSGSGWTPMEKLYVGTPGETVEFRSWAVDYVGRTEPLPEDDDTSTTLYIWRLDGALQDVRGILLDGLEPLIHPVPVNQPESIRDGSFYAYLSAEGDYTVSISTDGYGNLPPGKLIMDHDQRYNLWLPPRDNWLQNPGFEEDSGLTDGWQAGGQLTITPTLGHSGDAAVRLGDACSPPCLESEYIEPLLFQQREASMQVDGSGNVHLVTRDESGVSYTWRSPQGVWSTPEIIFNHDSQLTYPESIPRLLLDRQNTLHLLVDDYEKNWHHLQKPAGGDWTGSTIIANSTRTRWALDPKGGLHLIYNTFDGEAYRYRSPSGVWETPFYYEDSWIGDPTLAACPDHTAFVFPGSAYSGYYLIRSTGEVSTEYFSDTRADIGAVMCDDEGILHLFFADESGQVAYRLRSKTGDWSEPEFLPEEMWYARLFTSVDGAGFVAIYPSDHYAGGGYYAKLAASPKFERKGRIPHAYSHAAGPGGSLHLFGDFFNGPVYQSSKIYTGDAQASLSQRVTLPGGAANPTLSFLYSLDSSMPFQNSHFTVRVDSGAGPAPVFTATQPTGPVTAWQPAWVDMSAWSGATVTLTLQLEQAAGDPVVHLQLDEVYLGPWTTPVIESVTQAAGQALEVYGQNFLEGYTVELNDAAVPAANLTRHDAGHFSLELPGDLPPGYAALRVVNSDGTRSPAYWLVSGHLNFLPAVAR